MSWRPLEWLDAAAVALAPGHRGLTLTSGERTVAELTPVRACPWSAPEECLALQDAGGRVVAMIADPARLDPASRAALEAELARQWFAPVVLSVRALAYRDGSHHWEVDTSAGARAFRTRHVFSELPLRRAGAGAVIVGDDGVRYRIPDLAALDERSRALLRTLL